MILLHQLRRADSAVIGEIGPFAVLAQREDRMLTLGGKAVYEPVKELSAIAAISPEKFCALATVRPNVLPRSIMREFPGERTSYFRANVAQVGNACLA